MTPDQAMQIFEAIFADFSADELKTFRYEIERRLGHLIGKKISPEMKDKVARIIVEEIQMVLVARDG